MKIPKKNLNLEEGLEREWIIGNGIGGYSSSSVLGTNTRKYHGLLVAPLMPPGRRFIILSKVDESIYFMNQNKEEILYTNICKNYISEGYKNLESFEKEYNPIFNYRVDGVQVKKQVVMVYGQNTVCVYYKVKTDKDIVFKLAPIMNYRDFHRDNCNHEYDVNEHIDVDEILIDGNTTDDIGDLVLKDRELLSKNGIVIVSATIDKGTKKIIASPQILTRGFIYVKDNLDIIAKSEKILELILMRRWALFL